MVLLCGIFLGALLGTLFEVMTDTMHRSQFDQQVRTLEFAVKACIHPSDAGTQEQLRGHLSETLATRFAVFSPSQRQDLVRDILVKRDEQLRELMRDFLATLSSQVMQGASEEGQEEEMPMDEEAQRRRERVPGLVRRPSEDLLDIFRGLRLQDDES
eukprot:NODE_2899_length_848_cov_70.460576_g2399_i0.p1 GENE.NODE_2899_length_848_cov_70.460576_g2399_i0~~NODE_2899_length_848_cov_70.460576_g2399_i0.p1  ORF type:complete len:157 (-),score=41.50 NODE_2899_length_848_cov_70.460576_g2399_i0:67-537(-)